MESVDLTILLAIGIVAFFGFARFLPSLDHKFLNQKFLPMISDFLKRIEQLEKESERRFNVQKEQLDDLKSENRQNFHTQQDDCADLQNQIISLKQEIDLLISEQRRQNGVQVQQDLAIKGLYEPKKKKRSTKK